MTNQTVLKVKEVADKLRLSRRTIMRYISSKKLRATKVGQWRIIKSDLDLFLKSHANK